MTAALSLRDEDLIREAKNEQAKQDDAEIVRRDAMIKELKARVVELEAMLPKYMKAMQLLRRLMISPEDRKCEPFREEAKEILRGEN